MQLPPRIVLGISAGIAAYKAPLLIRLLRKQGSEVRVVLTPRARPFVGEEALRTVSGAGVYSDASPDHPLVYTGSLDHIRLADWGECLLIAPATANTIASLAHGIADNLLTTLALSFDGPRLIVAPAMNTRMWEHPATKANISILKERGVRMLPVGSGELACGTEGEGRMLEPDEIVTHLQRMTADRVLSGKKVVVSAGGTSEPIDPVRVISNRSSGKMGAAIAETALALGADVTMVVGNVSVPMPSGARVIHAGTAEEMKRALEDEFRSTDICIMAAAVCDYRPEKAQPNKIHKCEGAATTLKLVENPDILKSLGASKKNQYLVGFALEDRDGTERAKVKMLEKNCDLMVLNAPSQSLESDTTALTLLGPDGTQETMGNMSKHEAAQGLLRYIARKTGTLQ